MALTKTRHRMHDADVISIRDFGAVGDGATDDTTAIQAALNHAQTLGGYQTVIVPPSPSGNPYIFTQLQVKSQTTFKGTGGVLKLKNNHVTNVAASYYPINNLGHDRVIYDGLIVEANQANQPVKPVVCDTITAVGFRTKVINCILYNAVDSGIMFSGAERGECSNNYIENATDVCIYVNVGEGNQGDFLVQNNICKDGVFGGVALKRSVENAIVSGNLILSCGNGITVEDFGAGSGGAPSHCVIDSNTLQGIGHPHRASGPAERGISVSLGLNCVITNNKIQNCSGTAISLDGTQDSIISNNHCTGYPASPFTGANGNVGLGISTRVSVTTFEPERLIIEGNHFNNFADYGGYIADLKNSSMTNNYFKDDGTGVGLRINANVDNNNISYNTFKGATDLTLFSGADNNVMQFNIRESAATSWERVGWRRNTSTVDPNGNTTPDYAGEMHWVTTEGPKIFMAYGTTNTEWVQVGGLLFQATATEIADIASDINTVGKFKTKQVYDQTNNRLVVASGSGAADAWHVVDGSATITPS